MNNSILYSFRRCPYAMRARLAIAISGIQLELREVVLRDKPAALLEVSPKATVPVLITADGKVIDESLDIMRWALNQHDPDNWLAEPDSDMETLTQQLIHNNDGDFKHCLDRYKYADRFPEETETHYRQQGEKTLQRLEQLLEENGCLLAKNHTLADMALLPFIRQFAAVHPDWFATAPYPLLRAWLTEFCDSALFKSIMMKYRAWTAEDAITLFPA